MAGASEAMDAWPGVFTLATCTIPWPFDFVGPDLGRALATL